MQLFNWQIHESATEIEADYLWFLLAINGSMELFLTAANKTNFKQCPSNLILSNTTTTLPLNTKQKFFWWNFLRIFCQKAFMAQLWWWMEVCNKLFENCAKEERIKEKHIKRLQVLRNILILAFKLALIYTPNYEHKMSKFWHYPSWNVVLLSKAFHQKLYFCTFDIFFMHLSQYAMVDRWKCQIFINGQFKYFYQLLAWWVIAQILQQIRPYHQWPNCIMVNGRRNEVNLDPYSTNRTEETVWIFCQRLKTLL